MEPPHGAPPWSPPPASEGALRTLDRPPLLSLPHRPLLLWQHATLCFLMRLGLLEVGRPNRFDDVSLDTAQRATLSDMALLGLIYRPTDNPNLYYPTHLAQHLLSGSVAEAASAAARGSAAAASVAAAASGSGGGGSGSGGGSSGGGFLVLETNFRLYAYTASPLWAQVVRIFADLRYMLPNMVVGDLTRDSVLAAARKGVTAADIAAFLGRNAHPRMHQASGVEAAAAADGTGSGGGGGRSVEGAVMPENVLKLMEIWSNEPVRLSAHYTRAQERTHARKHASARAGTHARTHARARSHARARIPPCHPLPPWIWGVLDRPPLTCQHAPPPFRSPPFPTSHPFFFVCATPSRLPSVGPMYPPRAPRPPAQALHASPCTKASPRWRNSRRRLPTRATPRCTCGIGRRRPAPGRPRSASKLRRTPR